MKKIILLVLWGGFYLLGFSQQEPQLNHYMFNQMANNPGFAGSNDMICANALSRQQWVGFKGAPATTLFTVNAPIKPFGVSSGVGLSLMNDKLGFSNNLNVNASYAYRLDLGKGKLGIGVSLGFYNQTLDPNWFIPSSDYHTQPSGDPLIPENKESVFVFDMGFGLYYKTDQLFVGLSSTHLNEANLNYTKGKPYLKRHYYLVTGYDFRLANPIFEIIPSMQILSDGASSEITFNTNLLYNKKFWGGVSYKAGAAIVGLLGIQLFNGVRISYAYEFPTSDLIRGTTGSHEFMVNYCFNLSVERSPKKYKSIRFL